MGGGPPVSSNESSGSGGYGDFGGSEYAWDGGMGMGIGGSKGVPILGMSDGAAIVGQTMQGGGSWEVPMAPWDQQQQQQLAFGMSPSKPSTKRRALEVRQ